MEQRKKEEIEEKRRDKEVKVLRTLDTQQRAHSARKEVKD